MKGMAITGDPTGPARRAGLLALAYKPRRPQVRAGSNPAGGTAGGATQAIPAGLRFSFGAIGSVVGRAVWPPAGWRWRRSWLVRATVPIVSPVRAISQVARYAVRS
jgi:hypothetical protein